MASQDPGAGDVGVRPRSMADRRRLYQFRLRSKPMCDGTSPARGGVRLLCDNLPRKVPYYHLKPIHFGH
jgi:hypothetical protein